MMSVRLFACLLIPFALSGQTYKDNLFALGATDSDPAIGLGKKFSIHASRSVGPRALIGSLFVAGINQWKDDPGAWGRGADGFGKRYASAVGRNIVRETIGFAGDGVLKTDPRFFRSARSGVLPRLTDALSQVVVARTDSGRKVPAFANVGSAFAAGQVTTLWLPHNDAHFSDGLVYAGVMLLGDAGRNAFREFWPDIRKKLHK